MPISGMTKLKNACIRRLDLSPYVCFSVKHTHPIHCASSFSVNMQNQSTHVSIWDLKQKKPSLYRDRLILLQWPVMTNLRRILVAYTMSDKRCVEFARNPVPALFLWHDYNEVWESYNVEECLFIVFIAELTSLLSTCWGLCFALHEGQPDVIGWYSNAVILYKHTLHQ